MTAPLVSLCIPTYKRSRYLASLLGTLQQQFADFPYSYEIVVSDNASPDDTQEVVSSFMPALPIRYLRQAENIGGYPNWEFVMSQGRGRYLVYLSDDDSLLGQQVAATIAKMEADPDIVVVYAPWLLYDLVAQKEQGQFYRVPSDLRIQRNHHGELLDHILRHHIFPEIQITRRDAFQATMPRINEHAFLAFMHSADYLTRGAVLIQQQPFYVAITRYFEDDNREQLGTDEVEHAWDRYRGGLEYLLGRTGMALSAEERTGFHIRVQQMIAMRMAVAIRLRHHKQRSPVDTYYIAMRLKGMGYEHLLPVPLTQLASAAALDFLLNDTELNRSMRQLVCMGTTEPDVRSYLTQHSKRPVEFLPDPGRLDALSDALVFVHQDASAAMVVAGAAAAQRNLRLVHEHDLMAKFDM